MLRLAILLAFGSPAAASWLKYPLVGSLDERAWTPPKETHTAASQGQLAQGWSPRPTEAPGLLARMELLPRLEGYSLSSGTCAFEANSGNSFTCASAGMTCSYSGSHIGCCDPNSKTCNDIKTSCIDYEASRSGECDLPDDFHTLCCAKPETGSCYTFVMSKSESPEGKFTFLDCSPKAGTGTLLDYDPMWARTHTADSTTTSSDPTATETDDGDDEDDNGGGSSTNIGAIVGGAVGGAAALGLVGLAAFLLLRRRKKNRASAAAPVATQQQQPPAMSQPQSPGGQSFVPSSPSTAYPSGMPPNYQGYDPHMSVYSQQQHPQGFAPYGQQQQYPSQNQYPTPYAAAYQPTGSPPPQTTPSPAKETDATKEDVPVASELDTVNPTGTDTNRAELGGRE